MMRTAAGFPVLRAHATKKDVATRPGWIVLCDISSENEDDPYVVWWMDENGNTSSGLYCGTIEEAAEKYERRVTKEVALGWA